MSIHQDDSSKDAISSYLKYKQGLARDLAWLIYSPSLFLNLPGYSAFSVNADATKISELLHDIENSAPSSMLKRSHFRRVGLYFEALLEYLLVEYARRDIMNINVIGRNLQITQGQRTLGELDYLLEVDGKPVHLELAIKYYLCRETDNGQWHNWIGPNARDRLDIKINRMLNHQLPLGQSELVQEILKSKQPGSNPGSNPGSDSKMQTQLQINNPSQLQSQYFLRGRFFYHNKPIRPGKANENASIARWLYLDEFMAEIKQQEYSVLPLAKVEWMTGVHPDCSGNRTLNGQDLLEQLMKVKTILVAASDSTNSVAIPGLFQVFTGENEMNHQEFIMVVQNHWPQNHWPETNSPSRRI